MVRRSPVRPRMPLPMHSISSLAVSPCVVSLSAASEWDWTDVPGRGWRLRMHYDHLKGASFPKGGSG